MKFSAILFAAAAATLAAAHPSVEAIHDVQVRDPNTHLTHFDMHKRKRIIHKNTKVTFYWGNQLNNPACGGPTPNENEPVAAVKLSMGWAKCGDTLHVHWKGKMIAVKVVDDCGSCNSGKPWVDLARGMFKKIEDLDVGELHNAHVRVIHKN